MFIYSIFTAKRTNLAKLHKRTTNYILGKKLLQWGGLEGNIWTIRAEDFLGGWIKYLYYYLSEKKTLFPCFYISICKYTSQVSCIVINVRTINITLPIFFYRSCKRNKVGNNLKCIFLQVSPLQTLTCLV